MFRRRQNHRKQDNRSDGELDESRPLVTPRSRPLTITEVRKIRLSIFVFSALVIAFTGFWRTLLLSKSLEDEDEEFSMRFYGLHPMIIRYDFEKNAVAYLERRFLPRIMDRNPTGHALQTSRSTEDDDVCQPMHEWQSSSYMLCNPLHEFDTISEAIDGTLEFINCGGDRCAFKIKDVQGTQLALKTPKFRKVNADKDKYESSRIDGMAMERLTSSQYVLSTYGYCGLSQVIEYGEGGSIHDLVKRARLEGRDNMDPIDKLKVAIQLVTAVADLHGFEKDGKASITHNDLCCHQFILVDGVYKLNDFHLSRFLKKNRQTNEVCQNPMTVGRRWRLVHAPEEITERVLDNEKADDYVVGNVMYYVLTKEWIFERVPNSLE